MNLPSFHILRFIRNPINQQNALRMIKTTLNKQITTQSISSTSSSLSISMLSSQYSFIRTHFTFGLFTSLFFWTRNIMKANAIDVMHISPYLSTERAFLCTFRLRFHNNIDWMPFYDAKVGDVRNFLPLAAIPILINELFTSIQNCVYFICKKQHNARKLSLKLHAIDCDSRELFPSIEIYWESKEMIFVLFDFNFRGKKLLTFLIFHSIQIRNRWRQRN